MLIGQIAWLTSYIPGSRYKFEVRIKGISSFPVGIYLFKVNNRNPRTRCENMFKVNNKDTRTYFTLFSCFCC